VDEKERRISKFIDLQEDMHGAMRRDDRQAERKHSNHMENLFALKHQFHEEKTMRESEDAELLEKVSSAMERLHASILESFGEVKSDT